MPSQFQISASVIKEKHEKMESSGFAKTLKNVVAEYRNTSTKHVNKSDLIISERVHLGFISPYSFFFFFSPQEFDKLRECLDTNQDTSFFFILTYIKS